MNNFYGLQQLALISWLLSGDCIGLLKQYETTRLLPYSLRVHLIESDRIATPNNYGAGTTLYYTTGKNSETGNTIYDGVEVDADGMVTAHSGGTTVITARATDGSNEVSNSYSVKVIPVESVALNKSALSLAIGTSETLTATAKPDNPSGYRVEWWSSDEEIATVDAGGAVTAVAAGTAAITAYVGDKSASCDVTVTNGGSGGGGGGCSAGFAGLALLFAAALPAIYIKRR